MYQTEQEEFWAGEFGNEYLKRNTSMKRVAVQMAFFSRVLARTSGIKTVLELGANTGVNLAALGGLLPELKMQAVEINENAARECEKLPNVDVYVGSAFDYEVEEKAYDLTFTRGVLIHINPEKLPVMYEKLYQGSRRYILIAEYYNPSPVEVGYRGNDGRLFKRDFAGEFMDRYADVQLLDYGFSYHRDPVFPCDDITWFLMEKR